MILETFSKSFRDHFPDVTGRPVLVALSGGADSVALLALLVQARDTLACEPVAGHVHHHLRGAVADDDAAFCIELAERLGVRVVTAHLDPRPPRGTSPEAHWRECRYALLEEQRSSQGCAAVATAHTLDDQAETVLLKLLRGAGPRGVAGIRRRLGNVVRPLLDLSRSSLREWLTGQGITWREDATNLEIDRPRAWLRHRLLPALSRRYPNAADHLAAFAAALAEDEALLARELEMRGRWPQVGRPVALAPVARLPRSLRSRWVLELARRLPLAEPPSRAQIAAVAELLAGGPPMAVDLGRRWVLRRRGDRLHLSPPPCGPYPPVEAAFPSETVLPGGFKARLGITAGRCDARLRASLHPRVRSSSVVWRPPRPGERMWGEVTLSRALAAAGVVAEWRKAWPVLWASGTMVWIPAVGVASQWAGDGDDAVVAELEVPWEHRESSSRRT